MKCYISTDEVKQQLNIDCWYAEDDKYLLHLITVVQDAVERHIDHELSDLENEDGDIPDGLKHAMLLLIGTFYENRESVTHSNAVKVPHTFDYLIDFYKDYNPSKNKGNNGNCCCV